MASRKRRSQLPEYSEPMTNCVTRSIRDHLRPIAGGAAKGPPRRNRRSLTGCVHRLYVLWILELATLAT